MSLSDHITTILAASKAIPQSREDATSHSPEWRHLLQCIRNMETETAKASALGGFSAVFAAAQEIRDMAEPGRDAKAEVLLRIMDAGVDLGMFKEEAA